MFRLTLFRGLVEFESTEQIGGDGLVWAGDGERFEDFAGEAGLGLGEQRHEAEALGIAKVELGTEPGRFDIAAHGCGDVAVGFEHERLEIGVSGVDKSGEYGGRIVDGWFWIEGLGWGDETVEKHFETSVGGGVAEKRETRSVERDPLVVVGVLVREMRPAPELGGIGEGTSVEPEGV